MRRLFAPVDVAPLVYARLVFGALMVVEVGRYFARGWISRYYLEPRTFFTWPGFGWVRPLEGAAMTWAFAALAVLAAMICAGVFYRRACALFALGITWIFLLDQTNYLNHMYLICLFAGLMACVPAAAAGSFDARGGPVETAPAWAPWLLRGQLAVVYVFGAVAKLDGDWLSGLPARAFLGNWPLTVPLSKSELGCRLFALAGLLFDLLIVPALLWRRTRWAATAAALVFHLTNARLFSIGIFPWLMLAMTPLFWPPALVRALLARVGLLRAEAPVLGGAALPARARWIAAALGAYAAVQVLLPLRHWLYPGEVNWTEQGHNFSWHMKLRVKSGKVTFVARDPGSGNSWELDPREHLTARQVRKMATRPELIRQFAHQLARHQPALEVRAHTLVSLNGRPAQPLVDPTVDLAHVDFSWAPADWILPLDEQARPATGGADEGE